MYLSSVRDKPPSRHAANCPQSCCPATTFIRTDQVKPTMSQRIPPRQFYRGRGGRIDLTNVTSFFTRGQNFQASKHFAAQVFSHHRARSDLLQHIGFQRETSPPASAPPRRSPLRGAPNRRRHLVRRGGACRSRLVAAGVFAADRHPMMAGEASLSAFPLMTNPYR